MADYSYPIDYEMFSIDEITKIVEFYHLIEQANESSVSHNLLLEQYKTFQKIVNSKSLEKKMDREFEKVSGYSIYKTISQIKG